MKSAKIRGYEAYTIYENGDVYSEHTKRFLKPSVVIPGYWKVYLSNKDWSPGDDPRYRPRWHSLHRLVLEAFVCECPRGMECHHIDHNKGNNHVSNLEWTSHSENILRSFQDTERVGYWLGKERGAYSEAHRQKMAEAKKKPILARRGDDKVDYESIQACAEAFGCYREKVYRRLKSGKDLDGWFLEYV